MRELLPYTHPLSWYRKGRKIRVSDKMQSRYSYTLAEPVGKNFAKNFRPRYTPAQMLRMGVFEGKYMNDCILEFPREWYVSALRAKKLSPGKANAKLNHFQTKSRKSLGYWKNKGWIPIAKGDRDVRGWFQWYCRYYIGRRCSTDKVQIARWAAFTRHAGQIRAAYRRMAPKKRAALKDRARKRQHRPRQRQALLQWAHHAYV